jgi:predicted metal-dependent peptidase
MSSKALEIFASGRFIARRQAPYFRAKILSFVPRETPGLGTIRTSYHGIMEYDPETVASWTPEQMAGGFLHEALHSILEFWKRIGARDPKLFNVAQDLCINVMVREMGAQLPPGALFPEAFGFKTGLSTEEYYELLAQKQQGQGGGDQGDDQKKGGCASGNCGSIAGHGHPSDPSEDDPDGRSEAENQRANRAVAEAIRDAQKGSAGAGKVPGELLRWADAALQPPKVNWRDKLARVARQAIAYRPGCVEHRFDAPGRRQAGLGYGAGAPVMPRFRQPVPRVAVVVDTSGSMGRSELSAALRETKGVLKATGAEVTFSACDSDVHSLAPVRRWEDVVPLLKGGGGTQFQPALDALAKLRPAPEVCIFITDGGCWDKPHPVPGMRVIWLLVGAHRVKPCEWGEVIEVDDDEPEGDEE